MPDDNTLDELRELALAVAPELRQHGELYVIDQPAHLPTPAESIAYANTVASPPLREHLISLGQWRGPAPIVVFITREFPRATLVAILLHELAHTLPAEDIPDPSEEQRELATAEFSTFVADPNFATPANAPRWCPGHGHNFVRICLHLWARAFMLGEFPDFDALCGGSRYELAPAICYWRVLGAEPIVMLDKSFATILATKAAPDFTALWKADLDRWMRCYPENVEAINKGAQ